MTAEKVKDAGSRATTGCDEISILEHPRNRLAKFWRADGEVDGFDDAKYLQLRKETVRGIKELSDLLTRLEKNPRACIIRGRYVGDEVAAKRQGEEFKAGSVLRRVTSFDDQPLHTVMIEIDGKRFTPSCDPVLEPEKAIDQFISTRLPEEFLGIAFHWQLSGSAGHPQYAGKLRCHAWFWLRRPYTSKELKTWAKLINLDADVDAAVFDRVQAHFTASPQFEAGVADPVPIRSGYSEGILADEVDLDIRALLKEHARKQEQQRAERIRQKPSGDGLIDWFNARYSIEDTMVAAGYTTEDGQNWRSPNQGTGSFATKVFADGIKWFSLSGSDAANGLGRPSNDGRGQVGDAFDIHCFFQHGNDRAAALRAVAAERQKGADDFEAIDDDEEDGTEEKDDAGLQAEKKRDNSRFQWITHENGTEPVLNGNWLVKHVIPSDGLGVIFGRPGSGKTFAVMDIALHIASGRSWRGKKVRQAAVSYVSPEAGRKGQNRIIGWTRHYSVQWPHGFRLSPVTIDLRSDATDAEALIAGIKANQPDCRLVVIDTLNRAMAGGEENSGEDMGRFVRLCDMIAQKLDVFVLVVHHSGKDAAKGSRGHSSLLGAVSLELEVRREQGHPGTIKVTKMRDGEDGAEYGFDIGMVHLGEDEDGEPVTTGISIETNLEKAQRTKASEPKGAVQKIVARAFADYVAEHGKVNSEVAGFGEEVTVVEEAGFVEFAAGRGLGSDHEKRKQVRQALRGMLANGYFLINQGLIWRPISSA